MDGRDILEDERRLRIVNLLTTNNSRVPKIELSPTSRLTLATIATQLAKDSGEEGQFYDKP